MFLPTEIKTLLPKQFPTKLFDDIPSEFRLRGLAANTLDQDGVSERELHSSWYAMAYRLIAANDHATALGQSISRHGTAIVDVQRYIQERELYELFCSGLSTFETGCRAASIVLACVPGGTQQRVLTRRKFYPRDVAGWFNSAFPSDDISLFLSNLISSSEYETWSDIRNTLSHRITPGRHHFMGGPSHGLTQQTFNSRQERILTLDQATIESNCAWLNAQASQLVDALHKFLYWHYPEYFPTTT